MSRRPLDLVVVGASFAGLACARAAALRGLSVAVLERKAAVGDAPHTTGVLVKEVVDRWRVPEPLLRRIPGVRLVSPAGRSVDLSSPRYYFCATDTTGVLRWLADRARDAGARILTGCDVREIVETPDAVHLPGLDRDAQFLVGADGPTSRVARTLGLDRNREFLVGIEVELRGVRGVADDRLHCFLDPRLARGYLAWVVPGTHATQVGLAFRPPDPQRLEPFLDRLERVFDLRRARIVGRRRGLIPVGGPLRRFASRRALLIGDAAGWVSPLTGGGIHTALDWGQRAGELIAAHHIAAGPHPAVPLAREVPSFRFKRVLRALYDALPSRLAMEMMVTTRAGRALARLVYFHNRGLLSGDGWRELLGAVRADQRARVDRETNARRG